MSIKDLFKNYQSNQFLLSSIATAMIIGFLFASVNLLLKIKIKIIIKGILLFIFKIILALNIVLQQNYITISSN